MTDQEQIAKLQLTLCLLEKDGKPLLEGVREKCPRCAYMLSLRKSDKCMVCQGRDWVPSQDFWAYLQAARLVLSAVEWTQLGRAVLAGPLSFYQFLAKALGVGQ